MTTGAAEVPGATRHRVDPGSGRGERSRTIQAWRRLGWSAATLPVLVLLPLVNQPLRADHRFNVFRFGGDLTQRPWEVITQPLTTVPAYLDHGNFRPVGRIIERSQDLLAFAVSGALDLPVTTALRLVDLTFVALLAVVAVIWAETVSSTHSLLSRPPSAVALTTALVLPVLLVATRNSAVVLFTSLYFASAALVLLVAAAAAQRRWLETTAVTRPALMTAAALGGALAAFNEVAYLAAPLAALTVAIRGVVTLGRPLTDLCRSAAARVLVAGLAGFAAVFLPVRAVIAARCRDGGCYAASDVEVSAAVLPTLGHRLVSAMPGAGWAAAAGEPTDLLPGSGPALVILALAALLVLALGLDLVRRRLPSTREAAAAVVAGAGLLLLTSGAMALGSAVQDQVVDGWPVGSGWRDLPLAATGAALAIVGAGLALAGLAARQGRQPRRLAAVTVVVLAGFGSLVTTSVNSSVAEALRPSREGELFDRISVAFLHFDPSREDTRCSLLHEFEDIHPDRADWHGRLREALDSAAHARHDTAWCTEGTS